MDTPYQWTKQIASHWGGTRNGTVIYWPARIKDKGDIRSQFHHVIDVAPTILEASGLQAPAVLNGMQQKPIEGISMLYSFDNAKVPSSSMTQYFEIMGNRALYNKGWTAVTKHYTPWIRPETPIPDDDDYQWELYHVDKDWSQANNLADKEPEKLHELQRPWLIEAARYKVLPLDDRAVRKAQPGLAGRPVGFHQLLRPDATVRKRGSGHQEQVIPITADVSIPAGRALRELSSARAGDTSAADLYLLGGKPVFRYNWGGLKRTFIIAKDPLSPGQHVIVVEFAYAGGGIGKGATGKITLDGKKVAEGRLERNAGIRFSADDGLDVGEDSGMPDIADYQVLFNNFNGEVKRLSIALTDAKLTADHLVKPEDAINAAMGRQ